MNVAVFGATGRTGRPLIKELLAAGHTIQALVRSPRKLDNFAKTELGAEGIKSIKIVQGDIKDPQAVLETMRGTDAVVMVVGHSMPSIGSAKTNPNMQTIAMQNILAANPPTRIIMLTGSGVRFPGDNPGVIDRSVNWILAKLSPDRINDGEEAARLLAKTDLDWTIFRAFLLTSKLKRDKYQLGMVGGKHMGYMIDRADVAKLIVDILDQPEYFGKAPYISW